MRRKHVVWVSIFLLFLSGCSIKKVGSFEGEEAARNEALSLMAEKYQEDFVYKKEESLNDLGNRNVYKAIFTPKNEGDVEVAVSVTYPDNLEDDYEVVFFNHQLTRQTTEVLESQNFIQGYETQILSGNPSANFDKKNGLATYIQKSGVKNQIAINLEDGVSVEDYTSRIYCLIEALGEIGGNMDLTVSNGEGILFSESLPRNQEEKFTMTDIEARVSTNLNNLENPGDDN